ncbi:YkgJ family cysteine cluster protein [Uliginosibacterium sp. sgz301328]|uniref:YkgJ family cysteine cluster protein n=1 Tax=Uliginosibacterium sp. sgz301328 TaxID=3243764 RepID=UPI00359D8899
MSVVDNPCQQCGACCASFRVSFHRSQLDSEPGGYVPAALADDETASTCRMRGTDRYPPRCVALVGKVGESVRCGIYEFRPDPCREFAAHGVYGIANRACNDARARHGLPPLEVSGPPLL